jgi:hypothetical protein
MTLFRSTIIKVLKSGVELNKLDVLSEDILVGDIIEEATVFMTVIYDVKLSDNECV